MADEREVDLQKELIELLETQRSKEEELGQQRLRQLKEQEAAIQKKIKGYQTTIEKNNEEIRLMIAKGELDREEEAKLKENIALQEQQIKRQAELLKTAQKKLEVQKELNKVANDAPDYVKGFFSGKAADTIGKAADQMGGAIEKKLTGELKNAIVGAESLGGAMKAAVGPAAILALYVFAKAVFDLAIEVGNAENAFMKTTGASEDFARSLSDSFIETRKFGATTQETSAAMQSLFTNFTDFTMLNDESVQNLTKTATVLGKMGVSTDDFAKGIQNLTKAMGFNADAAAQQLLNLEKFAEELGVAPSKIAADFAGAGGSLAKFGDQGVQAFKRLEIASKITGMEMQRILTLTEKFDTFEGAATMAGKLNAALGGNFVNAMDLMMETDPVGRFEQIRDAILSTGMSFDDMTYFQKNMYKEMLGLQDVGELALLLSGRTDLMSQSFDQSAQSYEDAAERAKTLASFQEQLQMLFVEMIPVITPMIDMFRVFFKVLQPMAPLIGLIGRLVGVLAMLFLALPLAIPIGILTATSVIFGGISETIESMNKAIDESISKFGDFANRLFKVQNSPTIFEGVGMLSDMFGEMDTNIRGTTVAVQGQTAAFNNTPVPAMAQAGAAGGTSTQTVQQPVNITLNGEVVGKFVMETLGTAIKNISILQ